MSRARHRVDVVGRLHQQILLEEQSPFQALSRGPRLWPTEASVQWTASNGALITEGQCRRAVFYRLKEYEKELDYRADAVLKWRCGDWFEEFCLHHARPSGDLAASKVRIFDTTSLPLPISGELDGVNWIRIGDRQHFYLIDYKTAGGYYAKKDLFGNKSHKASPKIDNLLQMLVYLHHDRRLEWGYLVYGIRDDWAMTQFEIMVVKDEQTGLDVASIDGELYPQYNIQEIFRRYREICDSYEHNILPPRDYDLHYTPDRAKALFDVGQCSKTKLDAVLAGKKTGSTGAPLGDWRCSYCDYKIQCWQRDGEGREVKDYKDDSLLDSLEAAQAETSSDDTDTP